MPVLWTHERLIALQEILDEVVRELHKVKDEIINGKLNSYALCKEHKACLVFYNSYTAAFTTRRQ